MKLFSASISLGCAALLSACAIAPNPGERRADSHWAKGEYAETIKMVKPHAEAGEPWAQLRMGLFYDAGQGVDQDRQQAVDWYKKVAAQMAEGDWAEGKLILSGPRGEDGHFGGRKDALIAQWRLANIYYDGRVVGRDLQQAYVLINKVTTATQGRGIFLCCANALIPILPGDRGRGGPADTNHYPQGRYVTSEMLARTQSKIEAAMTAEELAQAREAFEESQSP